MENILHTDSKFSFRLRSTLPRFLATYVMNSHSRWQKVGLKKQFKADLSRLSETSPHLLDDIGLVNVEIADTRIASSSSEIDLSARV